VFQSTEDPSQAKQAISDNLQWCKLSFQVFPDPDTDPALDPDPTLKPGHVNNYVYIEDCRKTNLQPLGPPLSTNLQTFRFLWQSGRILSRIWMIIPDLFRVRPSQKVPDPSRYGPLKWMKLYGKGFLHNMIPQRFCQNGAKIFKCQEVEAEFYFLKRARQVVIIFLCVFVRCILTKIWIHSGVISGAGLYR
jgi:hypothetical protein